jgi:hypothetical protein
MDLSGKEKRRRCGKRLSDHAPFSRKSGWDNLFHGRPPLSEIFSDLILARLMPSGVVHTNRRTFPPRPPRFKIQDFRQFQLRQFDQWVTACIGYDRNSRAKTARLS